VVPRIPLLLPGRRQQTRRHLHLPGVAGAAVTGAAVVGTVVVVIAVAAADVAAAVTITDVAPASVYIVPAAIAADSVAVAVVGYEAIVIVGVVGLSGENHLLHWRTAVGVAAAVVIAAVFVANRVDLYHLLPQGGVGSYQSFLLPLGIAAAVVVGAVVVEFAAAAGVVGAVDVGE